MGAGRPEAGMGTKGWAGFAGSILSNIERSRGVDEMVSGIGNSGG
jgi:hypothetical protein